MQAYFVLFLNFICYQILAYIELSLFIEKLNIMSFVTIVALYIFALYNKVILKENFHLHPAVLFTLLGLMSYNYIISNKSLTLFSIFLFILFFVLDAVYNTINLVMPEVYTKKNINFQNKSHTQIKVSTQAPAKDERVFGINMKLEEALVLLGLTHDYSLEELKKAYRITLKLNNPKKFPKNKRETQKNIILQIKKAKKYLESRLL